MRAIRKSAFQVRGRRWVKSLVLLPVAAGSVVVAVPAYADEATSRSTIFSTTGDEPSGIVLDVAGNIYTANSGSDNVSKITPAGVSTIFGITGDEPSGIVLDVAGNIYTTNSISNNVSKI